MKVNIRLILIVLLIGIMNSNQYYCQAMQPFNSVFDIFDHSPLKNIVFNDSTGTISLYVKIIDSQFPYTTESIKVIFKNKQRNEVFKGISKELIRINSDDLYLIEFECEDVFSPNKLMKNIFSDDNKINEVFVSRNTPNRNPEPHDWYPTSFEESSKMDTFYYKLRLYYYNKMRDDKAQLEFLQHRDEILFQKYDQAAVTFMKGGELEENFKRIDPLINELVKIYQYCTLNYDPYFNNILQNAFQRKFNALVDSIKQNNSFQYQQEIIGSLNQLKSLMDAANGIPIPINILSPVEKSIDRSDINRIESKLNQIIEMIVVNPKLSNQQLEFIEKQIIPLFKYKLKQIAIFEPQNRIEEDAKFLNYQKLYDVISDLKKYIIDNPDPLTNNNLLDKVLNSLPLTTFPENISLENNPLKDSLNKFTRFNSNTQINTNLSHILHINEKDTIKFVLLNQLNDLFLCDSMFKRAGMFDCHILQSVDDGLNNIRNLDLTIIDTYQFLDSMQKYIPIPSGLPEVKNIIHDYQRNKNDKISDILDRIGNDISLRIVDENTKSRYISDSLEFINFLQRLVFYHSTNTITPYRYNTIIRRLNRESKSLDNIKSTDTYEKQLTTIKKHEDEISQLESTLIHEFNPKGYDSTYIPPQMLLLNELNRMNSLVSKSNREIKEYSQSIRDSIYSRNLRLVLALDTIPFSYYDSIQMILNQLTVLNNRLEGNNNELAEYRDMHIMIETLPSFFHVPLRPNPVGLESNFSVICKPRDSYSMNDFKRDSTFVINLLNRFPKVAENYYFNIMPDDKRKDFVVQELKSKDIFFNDANVDFKNIDVEALVYSLNKKLSINESDIAEQLSYKINYLNLDIYAGAGFSSWQNQDNTFRIQPFNLFLNTRLDTTKTIKGQNKLLGLDLFPYKLQPYIEGNIQTFSGRGAMAEFGYGARFINSGRPKIFKRAKVCLSPSIHMQGTFLNTETWKFNEKKGSRVDSLHIKSFYEIESQLQMNTFIYWPSGNRLGIMYHHSWSLSSINRTYNLVLADNNSNIFETQPVDYTANAVAFYYSNKSIRVCSGCKWYNVDDPIELTKGYNKLWYVQFQLRLNKN